jgi:hypothetical protein
MAQNNIVIVSHAKYAEARERLLNQLQWPRSNVIVVMNASAENTTEQMEDGSRIVQVTQNLYEYSAFLVPKITGAAQQDAFLLLHDTCSLGPDFYWRVRAAFGNFRGGITWLSKYGACNLCIFDRSVTDDAYELFGNGRPAILDKNVAIAMEHNEHAASPKRFKGSPQRFLDVSVIKCGTEKPYASGTERHVLYFPSIDLKKYHIRVDRSIDIHPDIP